MYLIHGPVPNYSAVGSMAVLPFAARAGAVNQAVPVWVDPDCHQVPACGTVPVEQRGISTLHQVPGQRP